MIRFIFVRVGAVILILTVTLFVARYLILQSLTCLPLCINVNLIARDLQGMELSNAILTESNLQRSNLSGTDLRWSDLSGTKLNNTVLANADLRGAKLIGADLRQADLRGARLNFADLSGALLDGADMTQLDLTETQLRGVSLIGTKLVEANLTALTLSGVDLSAADLSGANLTKANMAGTAMSRANLSGANLTEADLAGSWVNLANLTGANMTGADLSGTSLIGTNLSSARLSRARLTGANLVGALFLGTDLRSASLQGIRLVTSELLPQDLVDPELANLNELQRSTLIVDANLRGVQYNAETQWPSGKLVLLAGLLGQAFAEAVAAQQVAEPTPVPTPIPAEEAPQEVIGQPEAEGPAITFALSGPGAPLTKNLYTIFQTLGYTDTIAFRDVETNAAVSLLCESAEVDASLLARVLSADELALCETNGHQLISLELGTTILVIVTDPSNSFLTDLAYGEIPLVLTAETWAEVRPDWPNEPIMRFLTSPGSGALSLLREHFFAESEGDPLGSAPNTAFNPDEIQLVQAIATTPNSVGFFSLNNFTQNAEILKLATIDGVTPSTTTVASSAYTLTQPLMLYGDLARAQEKVEAGYFLWFHLDNISAVLERAGFALANSQAMEENRTSLAPLPTLPPTPEAEPTAGGDGAGAGSDGATPTPTPTVTPTGGTPSDSQGRGGAGEAAATGTPQPDNASLITETLQARLTATLTAVAPVTPTAQEEEPTPTPAAAAP